MKSLNGIIQFSKLWLVAQKRLYSTRNILKLSERGLYNDIFPNTAASEITNLLNKSPQCVYAGFDPTASSLHVGNLLVIINLLHWQRGGHNVIALLGGATGYIGDPSGRSTDRVALQSGVIQENIASIKKNLEVVFENHHKYIWPKHEDELKPLRIVNNETWYRDINSIQFVSDIGRNFRMGTMLLKQSVQTRINSQIGMSFTEFAYQIFQAYDWLHLLKEYDCRFQIGGSDQMGNISAGHELISRTAKKNVYGLTLPLVTTEEGDKFGKSAGNAIWLDPQKTSPFSLYQYFVRTKDSEVERLLKLFTFYSSGEIKDIMYKHKQHPEQRYPQTCLADQLTTLVHGEEGLAKALKTTDAIYSKDVKSLVGLSPDDLEQMFQGAPVVTLMLSPGITILELGLKAKCFSTESDAMRIIQAGGFYINHQRMKKIDEIVTESAHILPNLMSLLRVGKRNYYIVKWQT
ncbi:tyrosine--tRNA ligase, mitochondrial isoform X2 [Achroia grisella]|uniref:tyrosine--tRNA ligase, mitochondrial isoform X2 n=1 Tax=Achroia grisella TaxID=688607 RepID=UPI0027D327EF|nr:tyrosine--tRNA ligase, mitochondrial isoform X2 [Achroia grisella]